MTGDDIGTRTGDAAARPGLVARAKVLVDWAVRTRAMRTNSRFWARGGGVLSGGIAYAALFSVFAALTIGYSAFMAVLGDNQKLRDHVLAAVDKALPGLVDTDGTGGLISPDQLVLTPGLSVTSAVAVVVLLLSAIAAVAAMRKAVRAMFADDRAVGNGVLGKARDLGGFVGMALVVLFSTIVTVAVTTAAQWVLGTLGWSDATTAVLTGLGILVAFVADATVFVLIITVLAGQRPPTRDLAIGALLAGVGLGVVRILGTTVVAGSVSKNPLFTSVAVLVTLLVWVNLIARIVLLAAAWTANPPYVDKLAAAEAT